MRDQDDMDSVAELTTAEWAAEQDVIEEPSARKDTNPKDAVGITKAPVSTISGQVLGEVGLAMLEGALKYGRHNYRTAGVRASVYFDATVLRHLFAWWEGQDIDPDSGLSHVTKAIAGLCVLRDSMLQGNWVDDRPPRVVDQEWLTKLNEKVRALRAKYPNPVPACTQVGSIVDRVNAHFEEVTRKPLICPLSYGHHDYHCEQLYGHTGPCKGKHGSNP